MTKSTFLCYPKWILFYPLILGIIISGCKQSIYRQHYIKEMRKKEKLDSLFFGLRFGDSKDIYFDKCWNLNHQRLIMPSSGSYGWLSYDLVDAHDSLGIDKIEMRFIGEFDKKDVMNKLNLKFSFRSWAPWLDQYQSDVLIYQVIDSIEKWYPGNDFFRFDNLVDSTETYFKIDANRQIKVFVEDDVFVAGEIEDLRSIL